jgi:hypothetical protein
MADAPLSTLILDVLETWYGCWMSESQVADEVCRIRPGTDRDTVGRMMRFIKAGSDGRGPGGWFVAPCTSSTDGFQRRWLGVLCRQTIPEATGFTEIMIPERNYW